MSGRFVAPWRWFFCHQTKRMRPRNREKKKKKKRLKPPPALHLRPQCHPFHSTAWIIPSLGPNLLRFPAKEGSGGICGKERKIIKQTCAKLLFPTMASISSRKTMDGVPARAFEKMSRTVRRMREIENPENNLKCHFHSPAFSASPT